MLKSFQKESLRVTFNIRIFHSGYVAGSPHCLKCAKKLLYLMVSSVNV